MTCNLLNVTSLSLLCSGLRDNKHKPNKVLITRLGGCSHDYFRNTEPSAGMSEGVNPLVFSCTCWCDENVAAYCLVSEQPGCRDIADAWLQLSGSS